jgi:hypothetical protein
MSSEHVSDLLPEYAESGLRPAGPVEEHLTTCASCASELQGYRTLLTSLQGLRAVEVEPPAAYLDRTLRTVRLASLTSRVPSLADVRRARARAAEVLSRTPRVGYALASLGGAAVGATAIALVWWRLGKRAAMGSGVVSAVKQAS